MATNKTNYARIQLDDTHEIMVWKRNNGSVEYRPEYWRNHQWNAYQHKGMDVVYSSAQSGSIDAQIRAIRHIRRHNSDS